MNTYRITIINLISEKKRRVTVEAYDMEGALIKAGYNMYYFSEEIIKCVKL
jgi:hypothetical protein